MGRRRKTKEMVEEGSKGRERGMEGEVKAKEENEKEKEEEGIPGSTSVTTRSFLSL